MKKVLLILAACLIIVSCGVTKIERVYVNDVGFDTLRVKVLIFGGDTLTAVVDVEDIDD